MAIKIHAATRLLADWFDDLSPENKKKYVEDHPHSKHAERYDEAKEKEFDEEDNGDKERIAELKDQITELLADIKELRADGDSAVREKRLLESLRGELATLSS